MKKLLSRNAFWKTFVLMKLVFLFLVSVSGIYEAHAVVLKNPKNGKNWYKCGSNADTVCRQQGYDYGTQLMCSPKAGINPLRVLEDIVYFPGELLCDGQCANQRGFLHHLNITKLENGNSSNETEAISMVVSRIRCLSGDPTIPVEQYGVVSGQDDVPFFFTKENEVVVKFCKKDKITDLSLSNVIKECTGKVIHQSIVDFIRVATSLLPIEKTKVSKLLEVEAFVQNYGRPSVALPHDELLRALEEGAPNSPILTKFTQQRDEAIALLFDQPNIAAERSAQDKNGFLYSLLKKSDPAVACGLEGSVDNRLEDCSFLFDSTKREWNLVTRTRKGHEVWKDPTGLLWSSSFGRQFNMEEANEACSNSSDETGNLPFLDFRIPTLKEYKSAKANHSILVLRDPLWWAWTSSKDDISSSNDPLIIVFESTWSSTVRRDENDLKLAVSSAREKDTYAIRCVANP